MKNSYTQEYTNLNNNIKENREKISLLNSELEQVKLLESKARIDLINEESELRKLKYQQNRFITRRGKLIAVPITILTIIVEALLISGIYNIMVLPEEIVSKILVGLLSVSLGGCTCIATILGSNTLTRKIQNELHKDIEKNSPEYKKIVEKIKSENLRLEPKRIECDSLTDKVYKIRKTISQTQQSIDFDLQKLDKITNEIVNMVISEEEQDEEITKPYTRVKSKTNESK